MKQKDQQKQRNDYIRLTETKQIKYYQSFQQLNLNHNLLQGIFSYGIEKPSPIQTKAIGCIMNGNDVLIKSHSGSGKQTSLLIGMLSKIDIKNTHVQSLIVVPTRQHARGVNNFIKHLCKYSEIKTQAIIGGVPISQDKINLWKSGIQVVVGTPGRIQKCIQRKYLKTQYIKFVGFIQADQITLLQSNQQITSLLNKIPSQTQLAFTFSVLQRQLKQVYDKYLNENYIQIVKNNYHSQQEYYLLIQNKQHKFDVFKNIYKQSQKYIIYVQSLDKAICLQQKFKSIGIHYVFIFNHQQTKQIRCNTIREWEIFYNGILIIYDSLLHPLQPRINIKFHKLIHYDCPSTLQIYNNRIQKITGFKCQILLYFVTSSDSDLMVDLVYQYQSDIKQYTLLNQKQQIKT